MSRVSRMMLMVCILLVQLGSALAMGERPDDPYDPMIGPRNPRPGAEAYLAVRHDIPGAAKQDLLSWRPAPPDVLTTLAAAPSREVRSLVGGNRNTPAAALEKLAHDSESGVRQYVASNPATPRSVLEQLSHDRDENVQWSLQHNSAWQADPSVHR